MRPLLHSRAQIRSASPLLQAVLDKSMGTNGCWLWPGHHERNGYGLTSWCDSAGRQRRTTAHRLAYILTLGDIPQGYTVDHLCRTRSCVNPAHLEAISHRENVARGTAPNSPTVRSRITGGTCPVGHDDWNEVGQCRPCMRDRQARNRATIRRAYQHLGMTRRQYAERYGLSLVVAERIAEDAHV